MCLCLGVPKNVNRTRPTLTTNAVTSTTWQPTLPHHQTAGYLAPPGDARSRQAAQRRSPLPHSIQVNKMAFKVRLWPLGFWGCRVWVWGGWAVSRVESWVWQRGLFALISSSSLINEPLTNPSTLPYPNKTKQNKTKQNKTKQNKTKQNKTKQNKTKQNKTKQNKTKQNKTKQNKTKPTLNSMEIGAGGPGR